MLNKTPMKWGLPVLFISILIASVIISQHHDLYTNKNQATNTLQLPPHSTSASDTRNNAAAPPNAAHNPVSTNVYSTVTPAATIFNSHKTKSSQASTNWLSASAQMVPGNSKLPETMRQETPEEIEKRITAKFEVIFRHKRPNEEVQLIIELDKGFIPEGLLSSVSTRTQREIITSSQKRFIAKLEKINQKYKHKEINKFETIPFIVINVSKNEIQDFIAIGEITDIQEDELSSPSMAESNPVIKANTAWSSGYTGSGQHVVVIDTGVDKTHPFLTGKVISEACYSNAGGFGSGSSLCPGGLTASTANSSGINCNASVSGCDHGTHVAGTIAGNNGSIFGVAPDASIISINVFTNIGGKALSYTSDQIKALERVYALRNTYNIASINMSLGGGNHNSHCDSDSRKSIIDNLKSVGIVTVIASGNNGYSSSISQPACISSAIAVGSSNDGSYGTALDEVSSFSNSSSLIDLLAPGSVITSSVPGGGYSIKQGTSMAAPHVAGAWAVIRSANNIATVNEIESALKYTGIPVTDSKNGVMKPRIQISDAINSFATGSITINISPSSTVADGAQWSVNGGSWYNSGDTISGISMGDHSIAFKATTHSNTSKVWISPQPQLITLTTADDTKTTNISYTEAIKTATALDASGDGKGDIFWRSVNDGSTFMWMMDNTTIASYGSIKLTDGSIPKISSSLWEIGGIADINGDKKGDILLRNKTDGSTYLWEMNSSLITSHGFVELADGAIPKVPLSNWLLSGLSDVNGDGNADALWRNKNDGSVYVWIMNGKTITSHGFISLSDGTVPKAGINQWSLAGFSDATGDGKADVLWRNKLDGTMFLWALDGKTIASYDFLKLSNGSIPAPPLSSWEFIGFEDTNGDAKADALWRNKTDGSMYLWITNGTTITSHGILKLTDGTIPSPPPNTWSIVGISDHNGDGKADALWRNKVDGSIYLWVLDGTIIAQHGHVKLPNGTSPKVSPLAWNSL